MNSRVKQFVGLRCGRCRKKFRGRGEWNLVVRQGVVIRLLCPMCQTPQENAEAVVNESTLDYSRLWVDGHGRMHIPPIGPDNA